VRALEDWLRAVAIRFGPVFRQVTWHGTVEPSRLSTGAVRLILRKRAALAGIKATRLKPVTPHGLRAGFVTQSYLAGASDEDIMAHTRHPTGRARARATGRACHADVGAVTAAARTTGDTA
jgi:integrase